VGAGLASEAIYLAATVRLPWWRYGGSLTSWRQILGDGWAGFAACLAGIAVLVIAYLWGLRVVRNQAQARRLVWVFALVFAVTLLWLLPITSDLFTYLSAAHVFTDLGANPLLDAPANLPAHPLTLAYPAEYFTEPSIYGPVWALASAPATLGEHDVAWGLLYLKGLAAIAYLACAWSVERILRMFWPAAAVEGLYLFAWNPLVLLMAVGEGHNDIVMMAAVLVALLLLVGERWLWSAGLLALSVWIKYVSLVYLPLFALYAWRRLDERRRWSVLVRGGLLAVAASVLVLAPFWRGEWVIELVNRLIHPASWPRDAFGVSAWAMGGGLAIFTVAYGVLLWRMARTRGSGQDWAFRRLADTGFVVTLLAFVLGAARSQPWHLIWPIAWAGVGRPRWAWQVCGGLSVVMLVVQVWVEWGTPGL
jgi:hypothetical protein